MLAERQGLCVAFRLRGSAFPCNMNYISPLARGIIHEYFKVNRHALRQSAKNSVLISDYSSALSGKRSTEPKTAPLRKS